jgi:AcrR family transcriptional regulator
MKGDSQRIDRRTKPGRRTEIAEAALQVMAEHGLAHTTNSRIAAVVGLSGPALYAHFENRQELLLAAMDILKKRIEDWYHQSTNPDIKQRMIELGECHAEFMAGEVNGFVLPSFEFIVSPRSMGLAHQFGQRQRETYVSLASVVEEGQAQGSIRKDIDPRVVAWGLVVFAWAEDIARLAGLDEFIDDGISIQILKLFLDQVSESPEPLAN